MSKPRLLQDRFDKIQRDKPRRELADNEVWWMRDYIPNHDGAALTKRGGCTYEGTYVPGSNSTGVAYAPFSAGPQVVSFAANDHLFDITNSADRGTSIGGTSPNRALFYRNLLIWATGSFPRKYSGAGAPALLLGTPPEAVDLCIYKDFLVAGGAGDVTQWRRVYFSNAANAESWDTTLRFVGTKDKITALGALPNAILVFHDDSVERIRGNNPPGTAAANMVLEPLFQDIGATSPKHVCAVGDKVYFIDGNGAYETDGASFVNLAEQGGIAQEWRSAPPSGVIFVYRGYLFVSYGTMGTGACVMVCHLKSRSWFSIGGILPQYITSTRLTSSSYDLLFALGARPAKMSSIFTPAASNKADADGTAILPELLTRDYDFGTYGRKRWKNLYVRYDMRDAATDDPLMDVRRFVSPDEDQVNEGTSLTTLLETSARTRIKVPIKYPNPELSFCFKQSGNSSSSKIYSLEADVYEEEQGKI